MTDVKNSLLRLAVASLTAVAVFDGAVSSYAADKPKQKGKPAAEETDAPKKHPTGYTDTPFLPGNKWRVHDDARPRPKVVEPGKEYGDPPADAIVLFDGSDLSEWETQEGSPASWKVENGYMEVLVHDPKLKMKASDLYTKRKFGDCQLHIEWAVPSEVESESQGRGNSGVFFGDGKYEVQVLDSHKNKTYADGQASALYGWKPPLVNVSRKPGQWQTYDIIFEAPRFDESGACTKKAYVTILHNGVVTQHRQAYLGATGHKKVAEYKAHDFKNRIKLQDHRNPTRFRNIWIRELDFSTQE